VTTLDWLALLALFCLFMTGVFSGYYIGLTYGRDEE
jgi:hypothetical protein